MKKLIVSCCGIELEVAGTEFEINLNWLEAKKNCTNIGKGWRLPEIEELQAIYYQLYCKNKGDFKRGIYWSNTDKNEQYAFGIYFGNSADGGYDKNYKFLVRAVKKLV